MTSDEYEAFRAELERAIAPILSRYANDGQDDDEQWVADRWVIVCSHVSIERPTDAMTSVHASNMPGWMVRGLLAAGRDLSRRLELEERDDG